MLLAALVAAILIGAGLLPNPLTLLIGDGTPPT
jgi:hypothetical protein